MSTPVRVAVMGVSHWHSIYDASYLELLREMDANVIGISDNNRAIAQDRATRFNSEPFEDYRLMLRKTKPDFVLALGRHVDMPEVFRYLVETGIPFLMEKPWGIDDATVRGLAELADSRGTWVCVPFMARYTQWAEMARSMLQKDELGPVSHIVFRVIRPTMARYPVWDSPWMLSRDQAGGGALLNLGAHGFDVCRFITGDEPSVISAVLSNAVHQSEVEDYAHVTLRRVLSECFERLRVGRPPPITAQDCARAVTLIHDAYRLARR